MHNLLRDFGLAVLRRRNSDRRVRSLGKYNRSLSVCILLGKCSQLLRNLLHIGYAEFVGLGICSSFGLVSNEDVDVGEDLVEGIFEELRDERGAEVEDEQLFQISTLTSLHCPFYMYTPYPFQQPPQPAPK
jgi:hypothetical protein